MQAVLHDRLELGDSPDERVLRFASRDARSSRR
jgi:hypothetical protein